MGEPTPSEAAGGDAAAGGLRAEAAGGGDEQPGRRGGFGPVPDARTIVLAAVAWISVLVVMGGAAVGIGAILHAGGDGSIDSEVWRWVVGHRTSGLDAVAEGLTHIASTDFVLPITVLVAAALVWARRARDAAFVAASAAGAYLITAILKEVVARPRPPVAERLVTENEFSFPSGHATQSIALYGAFLVLLVASSGRGPRIAAWCAGALVALAVGWTRVYLGVHWLSDVVGGWMVGGAWLAMLAWLMTYVGAEADDPAGGEPPPEAAP